MKILLVSLILFSSVAFSQTQPDYKNPSLPIEKRVEDLLQRMTLAEKVAQMNHLYNGDYVVDGKIDYEKLKALTSNMSYGCIEGFVFNATKYTEVINELQRHMMGNTRLGIPVIPVAEGLHGLVQDGCTIFPQALALGSTFNAELINQMASFIGESAEAIGIKQVLAPDLDIARELRWGRVEETYGEDPYLNGLMGIAYINGIRKYDVACTPKHFAAHNSPMGGLNLASASLGMRQLWSIDLVPFEMVFKNTDPLAAMNAYSSWDGEPIAGSKYFLTEILRNKFGFKGYVYSDWGSIDMLRYFHMVAKDKAEAAKLAIEAGIDLEAPSADAYTLSNIENLINSNLLDIKLIDNSVRRILTVKFRLGLFDKPINDISKSKTIVHNEASIKLARLIAEESIVLLKNENVLPLNITNYKSIAMIGPSADQVQFGDYSWSRSNENGVTPLSALKSLVGDKVHVNYAKGCDHWSKNTNGIDEAFEVSKKSDVTIVVVGTRSASLSRDYSNSTSGEGFDLSDLSLPGVQEELIQKVCASGKPVIVVLVSGKPLAIPWIKQNIPAIVVQWYGGEQQGNALVDVLFGKANPSGKLNVSFPQSAGHLPCYYNYLPTDKGFYHESGTPEKTGRDYVFSNPDALWNFGYGLSYTNFELSDFVVSNETPGINDTIDIALKISNTGKYDGKEVIQLYVRDVVSSVVTPVKQLKAFKKEFVRAGSTVPVSLRLPVSALYLYNKDMQKVVEPGDFEIQVGNASDHIVFTKTIRVGEVLSAKGIKPEEDQGTKSVKLPGKPITVSGIVRDVQSAQMANVEVAVKGTKLRTKTDSKGKYTLKVKTGDILKFYLMGYQSKEVVVDESGNINILMAK